MCSIMRVKMQVQFLLIETVLHIYSVKNILSPKKLQKWDFIEQELSKVVIFKFKLS